MKRHHPLAARHPQSGFTLIEILVALAIVAVTLGAGLQASGAMTHLAQRQTQQWLAQLCAENHLAEMRLQRQLPSLGSTVSECEQAGSAFAVETDVKTTPNPNFRRLDVRVSSDVDGRQTPLLQLSTITGRY
jgi:general secretion pathway protein I